MPVSCDCCMLSGRGLCVGLITVQRSATDCRVSQCDRVASVMRRPDPLGVVAPKEKLNELKHDLFHKKRTKTVT